MSILLPACATCGHVTFPPHLRCARCGAVEWTSREVAGGIVEQVTSVQRGLARRRDGGPPPVIAAILTDAGARLIARVDGTASAGTRVVLDQDGWAIVARPAAPGRVGTLGDGAPR